MAEAHLCAFVFLMILLGFFPPFSKAIICLLVTPDQLFFAVCFGLTKALITALIFGDVSLRSFNNKDKPF